MSSNATIIEQLLLEIQEKDQQIQEIKQKAQDNIKRRKELEQETQELKQKTQDDIKRRKEIEEKARPLRLPEALSLWHTLFSNPKIRYRYEEFQPSGFTPAIGRRYPKQLVHWTNFHHEHKSAFSLLCNEFAKPEATVFKSRQDYQSVAKVFLPDYVLDDDVALFAFQIRMVEEFVGQVWEKKGGDNTIRFRRREAQGLDDVTNRLRNMHNVTRNSTAPRTPQQQEPLYDQKRLFETVCSITHEKDGCRDLLAIEHKSADKLTSVLLLDGLHDMEIEDIIYRVKISTDNAKRTIEQAEEAIAVVVSEAYDFMIDQGISYGYINGGNTFIFLFVRPEEPHILYYEKVILEDLPTTSSIVSEEKLRFTVVGLVAAFAHMALSKQQWNEEFRSKARNKLPIWKLGDAKALHNTTPMSTSQSNNDSPDLEDPEDYHNSPDTSPSEMRGRAKAKEALAQLPKDDGDSSSGTAKYVFIQSSAKLGKNTTTESNNGKEGSPNTNGKNKGAANFMLTLEDSQVKTAMPDRPYCTQACLQGLIRGRTLDKKCPNVREHRKKA